MCATLADTFETVDVFMDQTINYVKTAPNWTKYIANIPLSKVMHLTLGNGGRNAL